MKNRLAIKSFSLFNALTLFKSHGFNYLVKRSEKELFNFYSKSDLPDQALDIAKLILQ
ncbi:hypothetical protein [Gottfriedia solisilvae]|uniref:Uncharacterized protein n=1 Tax=Gottfriedia solisilvae TaxID=1516104 RepID=A0A8J3AQJ9_9BACI|nr:hypothetical protein [Gottfriedia solisilvae]GGI14861.1 hypothetical protein GCM10007380_25070 [Gottfriedia solisilvae]